MDRQIRVDLSLIMPHRGDWQDPQTSNPERLRSCAEHVLARDDLPADLEGEIRAAAQRLLDRFPA